MRPDIRSDIWVSWLGAGCGRGANAIALGRRSPPQAGPWPETRPVRASVAVATHLQTPPNAATTHALNRRLLQQRLLTAAATAAPAKIPGRPADPKRAHARARPDVAESDTSSARMARAPLRRQIVATAGRVLGSHSRPAWPAESGRNIRAMMARRLDLSPVDNLGRELPCAGHLPCVSAIRNGPDEASGAAIDALAQDSERYWRKQATETTYS